MAISNPIQPAGAYNFLAIEGIAPKTNGVVTGFYTQKVAGTLFGGIDHPNSRININTIAEHTAAAGVTIDGALLKDGSAVFSTPLPIASGGTAGATAAAARAALSAAVLGANSDITALTGIALSTWTPVVTGNSGATISGLTIAQASWCRIGPFIFVNLSVSFTIATANPTILTITPPTAGTAHALSCTFMAAGIINSIVVDMWWRHTGAAGFAVFKADGSAMSLGTASVNINGLYLA